MNQSERLKRNTAYPRAVWWDGQLAPNVRAVWDGKPRRKPRKGEWYLSGAVIEAYQAPNDLDTEYHIATLVRTRTETVTTILGPWEGPGNEPETNTIQTNRLGRLHASRRAE